MDKRSTKWFFESERVAKSVEKLLGHLFHVFFHSFCGSQSESHLQKVDTKFELVRFVEFTKKNHFHPCPHMWMAVTLGWWSINISFSFDDIVPQCHVQKAYRIPYLCVNSKLSFQRCRWSSMEDDRLSFALRLINKCFSDLIRCFLLSPFSHFTMTVFFFAINVQKTKKKTARQNWKHLIGRSGGARMSSVFKWLVPMK